MKNIQVIEGAWHIKSLYNEANTPEKRALVGYMIKTCKADDTLYGGALCLLRDIQSCKGNELYHMELCTNANKAKQIIRITELALKGKYKNFALSKREIKKTLREIDKNVRTHN